MYISLKLKKNKRFMHRITKTNKYEKRFVNKVKIFFSIIFLI